MAKVSWRDPIVRVLPSGDVLAAISEPARRETARLLARIGGMSPAWRREQLRREQRWPRPEFSS